MARFKGSVQGARGQASRLGHTGLITDADGWDAGVHVYAHPLPNSAHGNAFEIFMTSGSRGADAGKLIGTVIWDAYKQERRFEPAPELFTALAGATFRHPGGDICTDPECTDRHEGGNQ